MSPVAHGTLVHGHAGAPGRRALPESDGARPSRLDASLLTPNDDVATALRHLGAGTKLRLASGAMVREVVLVEDIPAGHKLAVRDLATGLRVRKYGEFIGRLTSDVSAGAWVHVHNLETSARRNVADEGVWAEQVESPASLQVLGEVRCALGESPVWDAASNRLYWIDVRDTPAIHMIDPASGHARTWPMSEDIGSIVLADSNRLLAGLRSGFAFFDPSSGACTPILDPEPDMPQNRLNDGKCDAAGRFWCGSMNPESGIAEGSLYVLDTDLTCKRMAGGWLTPNGIAWSGDGRTMYVSDTRRGVIHGFDFDVASGSLGERRVFADLGALPGGPDGATVDSEGYLWSAQWDGGCLIRYHPDGRMDRVVRLPVSKPTSCAFGGTGHRQLFVTTAMRGLSAEQRRSEPLAGRVLILDVGVGGLAPHTFRGTST